MDALYYEDADIIEIGWPAVGLWPLICSIVKNHGEWDGSLPKKYWSAKFVARMASWQDIDAVEKCLAEFISCGLVFDNGDTVQIKNFRTYQPDPTGPDRQERFKEKKNQPVENANDRCETAGSVSNVDGTGRDGTGHDNTGREGTSAPARTSSSTLYEEAISDRPRWVADIIAFTRECPDWERWGEIELEQTCMKLKSACGDKLKPIDVFRRAWDSWPPGRTIWDGGGVHLWIINEATKMLRDFTTRGNATRNNGFGNQSRGDVASHASVERAQPEPVERHLRDGRTLVTLERIFEASQAVLADGGDFSDFPCLEEARRLLLKKGHMTDTHHGNARYTLAQIRNLKPLEIVSGDMGKILGFARSVPEE